MNLCFDIGGMSTKVALIEKNVILKKEVIKYNQLINAKDLLKKLFLYIENLCENKNINNISIAAPGIIDVKTGEIRGISAITDINKVNFKKAFESRFNIKTFIENDSKCAALAELLNGNGECCINAFIIVVGTGIGGAIIINKKIFKGSNNSAGEIGYFLEEIVENKYYNGSNLSGMYSLEQNYKLATNNHKSGKEIYDSYSIDKDAKEIIDKQIFHLAKLILNTSFVLGVDTVLVGGAVSANKLFVELLTKKVGELKVMLIQKIILY